MNGKDEIKHDWKRSPKDSIYEVTCHTLDFKEGKKMSGLNKMFAVNGLLELCIS